MGLLNLFLLKFSDDQLESDFRKALRHGETPFVRYFLILLILFNVLYAVKDFLYPSVRELVSIYFQAFFIVPVCALLLVLFLLHSWSLRQYHSLVIFLFLFTFTSQLFMFHLRGDGDTVVYSIMPVVIFALYNFSGILYKHSLQVFPILVLILILFFLKGNGFAENGISNTTLIFLITFITVILIKYRTEYLQRIGFYKKEILIQNEAILQGNNVQIHALSDLRQNIISVLAHDIRSPMVNLGAVLDMVKAQKINADDSKYYIGKIADQVGKVNFLINDILAWIKSQSNDGRVELVDFDLKNAVNELMMIYSESLNEKKIVIHTMINVERIKCQPDMIKSVLRNLVNNAMKFSKDNGQITVSSMSEGDEVVIMVQDNGVGISPEQLMHIGQTFVTSPGTRSEMGIGLGLRICQALVLVHGSKLQIESEVNVGTKISFRLTQPLSILS